MVSNEQQRGCPLPRIASLTSGSSKTIVVQIGDKIRLARSVQWYHGTSEALECSFQQNPGHGVFSIAM